jgi:hypothetical protein
MQPARKNNMKNIRLFGWVIVAINAYLVWGFISGVAKMSQDGSSDTGIGIYFFISLFVWTLINGPLYIIYRITGGGKRECPACGIGVKKGLTSCPTCGFDFARAAGAGQQQ